LTSRPIRTLRGLARVVRAGSRRTRDLREYVAYLRDAPAYDQAFFNFTVDFELGWSIARRGHAAMTARESLARSRRARQNFPALLEVADEFGIPLTIACVAHVALGDCSHSAPPFFQPSWSKRDWYAIDPHLDVERAMHYYGSDLLALVRKSRVAHEIASHGFSHVDLGDSETTPEVARFELDESFRILKEIEPELSTFVFPKNHLGHTDLLLAAGYTAYRGKSNARIVQDTLGLWTFPLGLWFSPIASSPREYVGAIQEGIRNRQVVNFYCHLHEFRRPRDFARFARPVFGFLAEKRDEGAITPATMRTILSAVTRG
jgi:peptidoglycan/xylan/chitin deacetylase (PgdA/CDA1 family)